MAEYHLQEMNDVRGDGKKHAYYKMKTVRQATMEDVLKFMEDNGSMVRRGETVLVLEEVQKALIHFLTLGYTVKIDQLGVFRLSLGTAPNKEVEAMDEDAEARNATSVVVRDVVFAAEKRFIGELNMNIRLQRGRTRHLHKPKCDAAERLSRALAFIDEQGFMRIHDYMQLTGLSRTMAQKELVQLKHDPSSGLTTKGRGTQKVYVRR